MPRKDAKITEKSKIKVDQEKFQGRLACLRKKAHEIAQRCESDVYVVLRRKDRYYTYKSINSPTWPPSEQQIKESATGGDHKTPESYPPTTYHLEGHTRIAYQQHQELELDKVVPFYHSAQPTYVPYTSTTPQFVDDSFSLYQPTRMQYLDHDAWTQLGLSLPPDEHKGEIDRTPSKSQSPVRSSEETRKTLGEETASRDQEHVEEAGVNYSKSHKRKFQTPEKNGLDSSLDKRRKSSHQSIHLDSKSFLGSPSFSPRAVGFDFIQNEPVDLADAQFWLKEVGSVDSVKDESPDPAAIRAWLNDGQNADYIKDVSHDPADTRA